MRPIREHTRRNEPAARFAPGRLRKALFRELQALEAEIPGAAPEGFEQPVDSDIEYFRRRWFLGRSCSQRELEQRFPAELAALRETR